MTLIACFRSGLSDAARRPKLLATLWALNLGLAAAATLPLAGWLSAVLPLAPEADLLVNRYSFGVAAELQQDAGPAMRLVWAAVLGTSLLALLAGPLLAGGILETLGSSDRRPFFHRFFRGGGHFYGRFLRLAVLFAVSTALVAGIAAGILRAALRPLRESAWEPGAPVARLILLTAVLAIVAWFWTGLDYARIHVSRDDSRRMWRAWMSGLRFATRFRGRAFALLALNGLLTLALAAAYLGFRLAVPSHTLGLIALMFVAQQAFMWARAGLRVALVASERLLHEEMRPMLGRPIIALPAPLPSPPPEEALPAAAPAAAAATAQETPIAGLRAAPQTAPTD